MNVGDDHNRPGDDLGRLLGAAFDAQARAAVPDDVPVPLPRFASASAVPAHARRRWARALAPLTAAAAVVAVVAVAFGLSQSSSAHRDIVSGQGAAASTSVHVKLLNSDGSRYGVGMPVIAYFSRRITDARELQRATTVTVNGVRASGAWYFEQSAAGDGPVEGDFRLPGFWPAHARIHLAIPARGLSAGPGMSYDDSLTLDFTTGARNVLAVDERTHRLTVTSDGALIGSYPVSLGSSATPTRRGIKVIMEKSDHLVMKGPGYLFQNVRYTEKLTYGGEYLHAAPWNVNHIRRGVDSSNGCTNMLPVDAARLYQVLRVGDVVDYPDAAGPRMTIGSGYGDWDVPWPQWLTGGLVRTH